MTDDRNEDGKPRRRRRFSLKLAVAALVVAVAGATYSYRVGNEMEQLREQVVAQSQLIQQTALDVAVLKASGDRFTVDPGDPPTICWCVKRGLGAHPPVPCVAKNATCDGESRQLCQA